MKESLIISIIFFATVLNGCNQANKKEESKNGKASKVELRETDGTYRLFVDGNAFYVQGAGCECGDIESLARHGANSFRTWMDSPAQRDGTEMLDEADGYGLKIMMGIKVGRERHGFDYNNAEAVAAQLAEIKETVLKYKDHPALLGWGIGNELNLRAENMKVWDAVNEISKMIHEIDGNHPTTTMLAGIGKREVDYFKQIDIDLDFLCIQMYADIVNLQQRLDDAGYDGPYIVTEWGATGHWEVGRTAWDVAIEQTSSEKAAAIKARYENVILKDSKYCMGSYVFFWGQKQERTPTWYGLFSEKGEETEAIDVMHNFWNGKWPENRAPRMVKTELDGKERYDNIVLDPGKEYAALIEAVDPDDDPLSYRIEIMKESTDLKDGGDAESRPESLELAVTASENGKIMMTSPQEKGPYRLFVYVTDGHNHVATVNFPFLVK